MQLPYRRLKLEKNSGLDQLSFVTFQQQNSSSTSITKNPQSKSKSIMNLKIYPRSWLLKKGIVPSADSVLLQTVLIRFRSNMFLFLQFPVNSLWLVRHFLQSFRILVLVLRESNLVHRKHISIPCLWKRYHYYWHIQLCHPDDTCLTLLDTLQQHSYQSKHLEHVDQLMLWWSRLLCEMLKIQF